MNEKNEKKICSLCKERPATIFFTNVSSDNKFVSMDLCDECAKAKGITESTGFTPADLLFGLGAAQEIEQTVSAELKCPRCAFSQADFKKSGRLGCPDCYRTFAEGLASLLKTMHKGTRHTGKAPEALRASRENTDRLKSLQKKLAKAIEGEDYELAAGLRDEIKSLTGVTVKTR